MVNVEYLIESQDFWWRWIFPVLHEYSGDKVFQPSFWTELVDNEWIVRQVKLNWELEQIKGGTPPIGLKALFDGDKLNEQFQARHLWVK